MAALHAGGNTSASGDGEASPPPTAGCRRGGWITTPFIIASVAGLTLAGGGWLNNLIVFLIQEFSIKSINAAQINNVVCGCSNFFPVLAAILADSFLGCFSVIWISSIISLLFLFRPIKNPIRYFVCSFGSRLHGARQPRFTLTTFGANQFNRLKHQTTYFNLYFFTLYVSSFISATGIVYVEDNLSWAWGYGICIAANLMGLAVFLAGSRFYYHDKLQESPFTSLARVVVACVRKRNAEISSESADYYYGDADGGKGAVEEAPTESFRILNRAALKTEGDVLPNGSISKLWKLCTVQQVEDLKSLIRILPLWSSSILLSTPIGIQGSLTVLQALTTNRHLGHRFQIPAGSMMVFSLISTAMSLTLFDHFLWPMWKRVAGKNPTSLQQIGVGHVFNITSMAVSAIVESKKAAAATSHHLRGVPMSVLWLVPQLLGVAYYLSTAVVDFVRRVTEWLPDDIDGRVDNVYWLLVVIGVSTMVIILVFKL
ncbi:UNVERIFIED_CONTAM: protein NRT1/ PTR FAMILY 2.6 [Sesamum latifolium]|uniref:Protein NRT1/ PTR FAMILY 2.6 n=1 Tax=Sesamum latifolium TaxID=2727402 RepID=A0AAW2Y565_9LAMI